MRKNRSKMTATEASASESRRTDALRFMRGRFNADCYWEMDGPPDTDVDRMLFFAYDGGTALIMTWCAGGWSIWTDGAERGEYDKTEAAMRLQLEDRQRGNDAPLTLSWVERLMKALLPRMSDEIVEQCSQFFYLARGERMTPQWREENKTVRIPVEGMTPQGFPEPIPGPTTFARDTHDLVPDAKGNWRVSFEASSAIGIEIAVKADSYDEAEELGVKWLKEHRSKLDDVVTELVNVDEQATRGYAEKIGLPITHVTVGAPDDEGFDLVDVWEPT